MRTLKLLVLAAVTVLCWAGPSAALDAPHDGSFSGSPADCQTCHRLHVPVGGTFTNWPTNNEACLTCHDGVLRAENNFFKPDWSSTGSQAVPGSAGIHHKWSGSPGVNAPTNPEMASYLDSGNLQCSVCHDVHGKKDATGMRIQDTFAPQSAFSSYPVGVQQAPMNPPETGGLTVTSLYALDFPLMKTYQLEVMGAGSLRVSDDFWMATPTWTTISFTVGNTPANDRPLPQDENVLVRMTSTPSVGATWQFFVSYPNLRVSNVGDAMCLDCHADRNMNHTTVEGGNGSYPADGTNYFSHPVNQALGENGKGYDAADPLDADGSAQGEATEQFPSNKLSLVEGKVGCTTCHAPHNADSNSLTNDVR